MLARADEVIERTGASSSRCSAAQQSARSRCAGKPAFVSMIGLLSSRPPFGRIEQPAWQTP
jgi:hypothetical protein